MFVLGLAAECVYEGKGGGCLTGFRGVDGCTRGWGLKVCRVSQWSGLGDVRERSARSATVCCRERGGVYMDIRGRYSRGSQIQCMCVGHRGQGVWQELDITSCRSGRWGSGHHWLVC
jgi:hypothetical protein